MFILSTAHSSYLCRRVLPLIDCELEQVLGGSTENEDTSGAGALFKVSGFGQTSDVYYTGSVLVSLWINYSVYLFFVSLQITCKDKSLLLYSKSKMEAVNWFNCIRDAIKLVTRFCTFAD